MNNPYAVPHSPRRLPGNRRDQMLMPVTVGPGAAWARCGMVSSGMGKRTSPAWEKSSSGSGKRRPSTRNERHRLDRA